jgi:hypothetical protein
VLVFLVSLFIKEPDHKLLALDEEPVAVAGD